MVDKSKSKMTMFYIIIVAVIAFFGITMIASVYLISNHTDFSGGLVTFIIVASIMGLWGIKHWIRDESHRP